MRKMGVYLGLVEDDDYGDAYSDSPGYEHSSSRRSDYAEHHYSRDGHARDGHARAEVARAAHASVAMPEDAHSREYAEDLASRVGRSSRSEHLPAYQITTLHPRTYNEARTIGEHFRKNTPVIMNLSEMEDADAKRLVDFAAGLTFGLHGRIERVTAKVFLLSPHNVTVTAADKARIAETGFFNQS
jgi:cell division inhibitor SepF